MAGLVDDLGLSEVAPATGPRDEAAFRAWYRGWAQKAGLDPNPDNPEHRYDYRAAFRAGAEPAIDPSDGRYHWPSRFKADDHPNRFVDGVDTKTGQSVALIDDLNLSAPEPPGPLSRAATTAAEAVANLPRLVTEGVPAAARAFMESQTAPTVGMALRRSATTEEPVFGGEPRRPSFAQQVLFGGISPIPGLLDLGERVLRAPVSLGRAAAELGPEQAKPLTEALATAAVLLPPRAAGTALATDVRGLLQGPRPARPMLALPPGPPPPPAAEIPIPRGAGTGATPGEQLTVRLRSVTTAPGVEAPAARYGLPRIAPKRPYAEPPSFLEGPSALRPGLLVDDLDRPVEIPQPRAAEPALAPAPAPASALRTTQEIIGARFNLPAALMPEEEVRRIAVRAEQAITEALRTGEIPARTLSGAETGAARPEALLALTRAAVGGVLGGSVGETPEERVRNALIGAGLGVVASGSIAKRIVQAVRDETGALKPGVGQRLREQVRKGKTLEQAMADEGLVPAVRPAPAATTTAAKSAPPKPLLTEEAALRIEQEAGGRLPGDLKGRRLSTETTRRVVSAAEQAMLEGGVARDPDVPITLQIVTTMTRQPELYRELKRALETQGASLDDVAQMFMATASNAGRQLQQLSAVQQRLAAVPELRALSQALGRAQPPMSGWEIAGHWWSRFVNIWRGSIVSALSTTVRNIETQAVRFPMATLEKTVEGTLQKMFRLGPESERGLDPAIQHVMDTWQTLVRKDRRGQVDALVKAFPDETDELFYRWASDVEMATKTSAHAGILSTNVERVLSRAEDGVKLVNVLNRGQEFFTRKVAFRVKLAEILRKRNVDIENIGPGQVKAEDVAEAVNHALEMTYSSTPKSGLAKALLDLYANPLGKSLSFVLPFPRFMMNSWRYLFEYNPTGLLKLLSRAERERIAAGDTSTISKAVVGSGLLLAAWQIRNSEHAGERWYEVKAGDRRVDMRPFAPFAQYLFIAELGKRLGQGNTVDKTTARELASGLLPELPRRGRHARPRPDDRLRRPGDPRRRPREQEPPDPPVHRRDRGRLPPAAHDVPGAVRRLWPVSRRAGRRDRHRGGEAPRRPRGALPRAGQAARPGTLADVARARAAVAQ